MTIEVGDVVVPDGNNIYMNWPVKANGYDAIGIVTRIIHNNPRVDLACPDFSYEILVAEQTILVWEVDVKVLSE